MFHHGWLPPQLDHVNGNPRDNRIENLRPATRSQNALNRCAQRRNKVGVKNVVYNPAKRKFEVRLMVGDKNTHFGMFSRLEDAATAAAQARTAAHGDFANHKAFTVSGTFIA
jgi:hypothetical protein